MNLRRLLFTAWFVVALVDIARADTAFDKELLAANAACPVKHVAYNEDHTQFFWVWPAGYEGCDEIRKAALALYERQAAENLRAQQELINRVARKLREAATKQ